MSDTLPETTSRRREFLGQLAAGAMVLAASGLSTRAEAESAAARRSDSPFDDSWVRKIKGKHRMIYDATEVNNGMPLIWPHIWMLTSNQADNIPESDMTAVVVLRHSGIPMALDDAVWSKYKLGEFFKIDDPLTKQPSTRNIYTNLKGGELPFPEAALEKLQQRGAVFVACNVALNFYSGMVGGTVGVSGDQAFQEWKSGLLPGITVVPSGVYAVNRAQEAGCKYVFAG